VKLFGEPQYLEAPKAEDPHAGITQIDFEEQTAGYQAAYSKLATAERAEADPVGYVQNPQQFVGEHLVAFSKAYGQGMSTLVASADATVVGPFLQGLAATGYQL
jgi:exportin-2 (importin alpha re-exporter)